VHKFKFFLISLIVLTWLAPLPSSEASEAAYERARSLLPANLKGLVRNESLGAHWFATGDTFWYRREADHGSEYVIVDARTGNKRPAFNAEQLAISASKTTGTQVDPHDPRMLLSPTGQEAVFVRDNNLWLRWLKSGEEKQLTFDAEPYYGYGIIHDQQTNGPTRAL